MTGNGNGRQTSGLFSPVQLGPHLLPNRIVMAPMSRRRADGHGVPGPLTATYYAQRATAGLIVTEAAHVSPEGMGPPGSPGMHTEDQAIGWRRVTRAVHAAGGRIFLQLWHVGRISHPSMQPQGQVPVAPSAIRAEVEVVTPQGKQQPVTPRPLREEEIAELVEAFGRAARLAHEAEFDGVDIHAGNGYLIDQFLRDGANQRTDAYGGSADNRARFLLEITRAVALVWGPERIGVRISPLSSHNGMRDSDPFATFTYVAKALAQRGVGYLHVVEHGVDHPRSTPLGLRMLQELRSIFRGRLAVDGGLSGASAERALTGIGADLVALATPFIANPDLVDRLAWRLPLASPDPTTFYVGGERGYVDYPISGRRVAPGTRSKV
jgi:N-ethylmaleimide reductase